MVEKVTKLLKDSTTMRWTALILVSLLMFFAYMFVDVLSPLQSLLETSRGWSPEVYGTFASSEYVLNVFVFFLIFAGIILDKMGVRFTAVLAASVMVVGASIKLYAISNYFIDGGFGFSFFDSFWTSFPASAKLACIGFAIFGCGVEMAGVTVSKAIVKWFNGKELAMAMGVEMAIARLGVFAVFRLSPYISDKVGQDIVIPVAISCGLLCIGLLSAIIYFFMDRKLDKQTNSSLEEAEEPFKISDIGKLFKTKTFMIIAGLCVLYYSAIFPFQKFAVNMLQTSLDISATEASAVFSWFPIGAMVLTPLLGFFLDRKGKAATMLILGSVLVCACHLVFALVPLNKAIAYSAIILLGISFSLVPAALWPSVPKLVENRYLGSGYSVIFWIQNIGLMLFPMLIGFALTKYNPGVSDNNKNHALLVNYGAYQANEYVNDVATYVLENSADENVRGLMQEIANATTIQNSNRDMLGRLLEDKKDVDQILTPSLRANFASYAIKVNDQVDQIAEILTNSKDADVSKDGDVVKEELTVFGESLNKSVSREGVDVLISTLPFLNSNIPFVEGNIKVSPETHKKIMYYIANIPYINFTKECLAKCGSMECDTLFSTKLIVSILEKTILPIMSNSELVSDTVNKRDFVLNDRVIKGYENLEALYNTNVVISEDRKIFAKINPYNYRIPMLIFALLGILAFFLGIWLKIEDKKHNYGLEAPNIKKKN